jgi:NAD(P)-dependent dehydrogenase (short-subunit alcohol dehydrogenase family)
MSLEGRNAVVTGGTRGIGLAITRALLEEGACVFICARKKEEVERAIAELAQEYGERIKGDAAHVGEYEQVCSLFASSVEAFGGIDILINNAGIGTHNFVEQMTVEEWKATIDTNLSGLFYCCHEALPLMKARGGGYIINIGSLAGKEAFAGGSAYCASKFGLVGFSEALMQEVRYDQIRVSYIMPGSVNTSFGRSLQQDSSATWKLLPEDVAEMVVHLLESHPRALSSRVELRPSTPKK